MLDHWQKMQHIFSSKVTHNPVNPRTYVLNDDNGHGWKAEMTDADITWVLNKACQKPKDYGYSAELWCPASFLYVLTI